MSITAMERLMFVVGITDLVSGPAASINKTIAGMKANATSGFDAIRGGAIGLAGAGLAIKTFMEPVYEMQRALGEVESLGVHEKELKSLQKTALGFSMKYGESAEDFVRSSYDIQSAIGGLENGELATFTKASNVLAKGTKADAATITSYMGTMYGIFQNNANAMGKARWVEQLTGQTAAAVKMFKTNGQEMSGAFSTIGSAAQAAGVDVAEQMAVLGTLQATMSGSEAATKYRSFLSGAAKAQEKLGLKFTDNTGKLLPMVEILNRINGKYSDLQDTAQLGALKNAFGSDEAVALVTNLIGKTDGLNKSIGEISMITGMDNAAKMAQTMVDPWDQFNATTKAVRISLGTLLLPTINAVLGKMNSGLTTVIGWTDEFPNLTKWIGLAALSVLALAGATGIFTILMGLGKTAMAASGVAVLAYKSIVVALAWVTTSATMKHMLLWTVFKAGSVIAFALTNALHVVRAGMILMGVASATATAPLWATVAVIGAIIAGVGWLIYKIGDWLGWWDKLTNLLQSTEWGTAILDTLGAFGEKISELLSWLGLIDDTNVSVSGTAEKSMSVTKPEQMPELAALRRPDASVPSASASLAGMMGNNKTIMATINSQNPFNPADLDDWAQYQGG
ncbi:phage tail tape measure protein [Thalassolituus sp.]|uniref:phage tail tape measure protein n=1 Tax=Thalassolituus sp. TaxID=2030822 RepID=UPI0035182645